MCSAYGVTPVYIQWSMNLGRCLRKFHQESSSPLKNKICHNPNRSEMCTASEFGHCSLLIHLWLLPVRAAWCLPFSLLSHVEIKHPQRGTSILQKMLLLWLYNWDRADFCSRISPHCPHPVMQLFLTECQNQSFFLMVKKNRMPRNVTVSWCSVYITKMISIS